jgi:hypothetical protein
MDRSCVAWATRGVRRGDFVAQGVGTISDSRNRSALIGTNAANEPRAFVK